MALPTRQRPYSLLSYKAVLEYGLDAGGRHLFAYVNRGAIKSLSRLGVPSDLVEGREFHLPVGGGYDLEYIAVHFEATEETARAFNEVDPTHPLTRIVAEVSLPVVVILDDPADELDLTDAVVGDRKSASPDLQD